MNRMVVGSFAMLLFGAALPALDDTRDKDNAKERTKADKPRTPAEQYLAVAKDFQNARQDFRKAFLAAKSQEERNKLIKENPPMP
jgi:hypothetical protein